MTMKNETTTYRMADDSLIYGEYTTVGDLGYFDDCDDGTQIVEERWVLVTRRIGTVHGQVCPDCMGEGFRDDNFTCESCKGTGEWQGERITWVDAPGDEAGT